MATAPSNAGNPAKVIIDRCVISYPNLFKPRAAQVGADPKFSSAFIIDGNTGRPILEKLNSAAKHAGREKFGNDFEKLLASGRFRMPFRKGEERMDSKGYGPGKWFINCTSTEPPGVVDKDMQPIMNPREIYAGCVVRASVTAFGYDRNGNRGVAFGLGNVQKIADGDPLGGRSRPEDDFGPIGGDDPVFQGGGGTVDDMFR